VPSVTTVSAGLAILKIFAWQDRQATDKDALDLYRLMTTYADAGNTDRLYDSEPALLDESGFDLEIAGRPFWAVMLAGLPAAPRWIDLGRF
jgi:predicted nucleotidyltransferase